MTHSDGYNGRRETPLNRLWNAIRRKLDHHASSARAEPNVSGYDWSRRRAESNSERSSFSLKEALHAGSASNATSEFDEYWEQTLRDNLPALLPAPTERNHDENGDHPDRSPTPDLERDEEDDVLDYAEHLFGSGEFQDCKELLEHYGLHRRPSKGAFLFGASSLELNDPGVALRYLKRADRLRHREESYARWRAVLCRAAALIGVSLAPSRYSAEDSHLIGAFINFYLAKAFRELRNDFYTIVHSHRAFRLAEDKSLLAEKSAMLLRSMLSKISDKPLMFLKSVRNYPLLLSATMFAVGSALAAIAYGPSGATAHLAIMFAGITTALMYLDILTNPYRFGDRVFYPNHGFFYSANPPIGYIECRTPDIRKSPIDTLFMNHPIHLTFDKPHQIYQWRGRYAEKSDYLLPGFGSRRLAQDLRDFLVIRVLFALAIEQYRKEH